MVGNHKQLIAHDAAATEISIALKDVEIRHMYIGGYAATFLGDERATEVPDPALEYLF